MVGPAQAESILAGLLDPRRPVAGLPVFPLDLEDQVASQVGTVGEVDHPGQGCLGDVESFGGVVEPPPTPQPEVASRQGVARGLRGHPTQPGHVAREGVEPDIASTLDHGEAGGLTSNPPDPVRSQRVAQDGQAQVMGPRKAGDRLHPDRDLADLRPIPEGDGQSREHPAFMGEDRRPRAISRFLLDANSQGPASVRGRPGLSLMTRWSTQSANRVLVSRAIRSANIAANAFPARANAILESTNSSVSGHRFQSKVSAAGSVKVVVIVRGSHSVLSEQFTHHAVGFSRGSGQEPGQDSKRVPPEDLRRSRPTPADRLSPRGPPTVPNRFCSFREYIRSLGLGSVAQGEYGHRRLPSTAMTPALELGRRWTVRRTLCQLTLVSSSPGATIGPRSRCPRALVRTPSTEPG